MIGFYVVTCDADREAKFNDGRSGLLGETSFVPMHQGVPSLCVTTRQVVALFAAADLLLCCCPIGVLNVVVE